MIIRFDKQALIDNQTNKESAIGVEGDTPVVSGKISEVEKIINSTKQKIAEGDTPAVGVSASNSGRGHELPPIEDANEFTPTMIDGVVEEEPALITDDRVEEPSLADVPRTTSEES